jgi:hypothetical protein
MSSERRVRTPSAESTRVPGSGQSPQGESKPKARPTGVVDGKPVKIPAPQVWSDCGGGEGESEPVIGFRFKVVG